jgi:hypothetical protein
VRCTRCGNENGDANRFCGMCGAPLAPGGQTSAAQPVGATKTAPAPQQTASHAPATKAEVRPAVSRPVDDAPVITGPSFLGLNKPAPSDSRSGSMRASEDQALDHLRSSRNLDYLLEDEEEPKRGLGKGLLILIALALAVGFGYLHWKQGGFDWLMASAKKPAAAQPADGSQSTDNGSPQTANAPSSTPSVTPVPADGTNGATNGTAPSANAVTPVANAPGTAAPAASNSNSDSNANNPSASNAPAATTTSPPTAAAAPTTPPAGTSQNAGSGDSVPSQPASSQPNAATSTDNEAPAKPAPVVKPTPAKPVDPVADAEKYIYGRGVHQNCDRGLAELKPAAEHSNSKAMISLGALYSTGVCTPRDLPTAYRWFALALRKDPDNQPLQQDLQRIWSQMTQPERQLAIQLSQ